ncbi:MULTISPECIES: AraC family transcriptional regulator [unclassified Vibrio]|uniref:Helix-turn-helix domain-containing protein n=1 Tax=Vibrio sp. HB236076 TaxID=3232307 RepID=A0AB39HDC1_9VIBR|nr:AraC family transcriptional regulator [Vibrio sp. HB161653]MDP5254068.1 helix-turn-helix transcriptional regulator [Vibrio sp. HB161653]
MNNSVLHFEHISDYLTAAGFAAPNHPLVATMRLSAAQLAVRPPSFAKGVQLSGGFYYLALKQVTQGQLFYGRTEYDCQTGTLIAMAPNQKMSSHDVTIEADACVLMLHPDYVRGLPLEMLLNECGFFQYQVNEALHVSTSEQAILQQLFNALEHELQGGYDSTSRDIILSQITVLMHYCQRFYQRQFIQRSELQGDWHSRLVVLLDAHYANQSHYIELPNLQQLCNQMQVSPRYLTDALKAQTGQSAKACVQNYLINKAKNLLLASNQSINQVAYELGYESAGYFTRIFKNKTGKTPKQFRESMQFRH